MFLRTFTPSFVLPLLLVALGCHDSGPHARRTGTEIARVGNASITSEQLQQKLDEYAPVVRARYKPLERKKELADGLVRFELLKQEAARRGYEKDPEVIQAFEKAMVQRLLKAETEEYERTHPLAASDVENYFREHRSEFVRPERVRISHVFFAVPKEDPRRAQVRAEAEKALAGLRATSAAKTPADPFADLARGRSDDLASRALGGDLGYRTKEELAEQWSAPVAEAAVALSIGQTSGVVATDRGLHVLKLLGRQSGIDQTVEQVKPRIESRLSTERRSRRLDELVSKLKSQTEVSVDEKALEAVAVTDN